MSLLRHRRRIVLGALFAGTVLAAVGASERDRPDSAPAAAPPPVHAARPGEAVAAIDLEKLRRPGARSDVSDVLASKSWYVAPPPKALPPPPPPPPQAPPLPFSYLGKMQETGGDVVFFLVKDNGVYMVRVGDVVDATYRIEGLAGGMLTLTYLPLNIQQTLLVGGDS